MHQSLLKRKADIKLKKINIRGDEIAILFLSLIFFIFLIFSSFRILPIGKLFDDFIFTLLFGWTKYLVYLLLLILVIPVFFNYYFKIKFSLLLAITASLLIFSWLLQNIVLIITNDNDLWFNTYHFHISMMQEYVDEWWDNSVINNYHGFFAQPVSLFSLGVQQAFPAYAVGGIISNLFISIISYPFILNFTFSILITLITFSWLIFARPFIIFENIFKMLFFTKKYLNKNNDETETLKELTSVVSEKNKLFSNKKQQTNSFFKDKDIVVNIMKQHAETRNKVTLSLFSEVEPELNQQVDNKQEMLKPEILFSLNTNELNYNRENSNLTPFGFGSIDNSLKENQEKIVNIIEENSTLQLLEPKNLLINATKIDKIINQTLDSATVEFNPDEIVTDKKYILPKLKPLTSESSNAKQLENERYALENKFKINQLFQDFSIQCSVQSYHIGTTVTKYEVSTVSGMKVNKITNLEDELKLILANSNIRIEAPIPGKSLIGIEVANKYIVPVNMQEQINYLTQPSNENKNLLISIGKTTTGQYLFHSLQDMPHLLIAGSTGAGKSVFINDLLISILLQYQPSEVKLLLIDPKWVELTIYNDIAHLLAPVITEPKKVAPALQVVILEMMRRYKLFSNNTCRNIESYNNKITDKTQKLPYYLIVIDELADLMIQNGKEVEEGIMRITQMGRAAGIHLVVATQRPSTDVITGVIKNNIPSRIAFQVASFIDSRTIIDSAGAEKLLGKGDMLFLTPGNNGPIRVQAPWISEEDVIEIIEFIKKQTPVTYDDNFINAIDKIDEKKNI